MSQQRILTLYPYLYPGTACDPLPAGGQPIWNPPPAEEGRRFVEAPPP
jgi:hypothetical protein